MQQRRLLFWVCCALAIAAFCVAFGGPAWRLAVFALHSDLYSYILLVPVISAGLIWLRRRSLPANGLPNRWLAAALVGSGVALLAVCQFGIAPISSELDFLSATSLSLVLAVAGLCAWFLGAARLRAIAFPLCLLVFAVPLPAWASDAMTHGLQHGSAAVAYMFFALSGMPVLRQGSLGFQLPGITLEVAPQCSGIHSSLALFFTSLPAGYLFLKSPYKRAILCAAAIPLGILRNGFRIFVIGELCVHIGPQMIDSYIHHTGGWIFFLLSLIPFFLLLALLMRPARAAGIRAPQNLSSIPSGVSRG